MGKRACVSSLALALPKEFARNMREVLDDMLVKNRSTRDENIQRTLLKGI